MRAVGTGLLLAILLAPTASAHATTDAEADSASIEGFLLYHSTSPGTLFERAKFLAALNVNNRDYSPVIAANVTAGAPWNATYEPVAAGLFQVELRAPGRGDHVVPLEFGIGNATFAWNVTLRVYPDLGVVVRPVDPTADYEVNGTYRFGVLLAHPVTHQPNLTARDLTLRFEHWSDDHKTRRSADEVPATPDPSGAWYAYYTFAERGMYHVRTHSRSLGLGWNDTPYIHVYAVPPPPAPEPVESPTPIAAGVLCAVLVAALVRRRGRT